MKTRGRNPFINSALGGRVLSASQLPLFLLRPPAGFGVITTIGRKTGKRRRRCIRAIRDGDRIYVLAIKGASITGWAKNALKAGEVTLRIRGGRFSGRVRELTPGPETDVARETYCGAVHPFDYAECMVWRPGKPTKAKVRELHQDWFESGTPLLIELEDPR